jgi:hypothetical protein
MSRGAEFSVKPLTQFNDLYQNISIFCRNKNKYESCNGFIDYLLSCDDINKIGMMKSDTILYNSEMPQMAEMEKVQATYNLKGVAGENTIKRLVEACKNKDINLIKNLLK